MTAEPSLFDKVNDCFIFRSDGVDFDQLRIVCAEYEKRLSDLSRNNEILASRLQKLMEKKK